jgi:hypothetical protein
VQESDDDDDDEEEPAAPQVPVHRGGGKQLRPPPSSGKQLHRPVEESEDDDDDDEEDPMMAAAAPDDEEAEDDEEDKKVPAAAEEDKKKAEEKDEDGVDDMELESDDDDDEEEFQPEYVFKKGISIKSIATNPGISREIVHCMFGMFSNSTYIVFCSISPRYFPTIVRIYLDLKGQSRDARVDVRRQPKRRPKPMIWKSPTMIAVAKKNSTSIWRTWIRTS